MHQFHVLYLLCISLVLLPPRLPMMQRPTSLGASSWMAYTLPAYDYTILVPASWKVFPPDADASTLSYDRTRGHDAFFFFARYHLPFLHRDPYGSVVPGTPARTPMTLANGHHAVVVTGAQGCRAVVWIYHYIERYVSWCGTDANELQLFMEIASRLDAPSRRTGHVVRPPANPPIPLTITRMLDALQHASHAPPPTDGWVIVPQKVRLPARWIIRRDDANGWCTRRSCISYAATPVVHDRYPPHPVTAQDVWIGYRETRLDYDDDPTGWYLLNPTYHGSRFMLANGAIGLLFARDEGLYDAYTLLHVEQTSYTTLMVFIGHDATTASYQADIVTVMQTFLAHN